MPGRNGTIGFPSATVPILGQLFEIVGMLISGVVICKCETPRSLLVTSNQVTVCPECRKGYVIQGVIWKAGTAPAIHVAIVAVNQADAPPK